MGTAAINAQPKFQNSTQSSVFFRINQYSYIRQVQYFGKDKVQNYDKKVS